MPSQLGLGQKNIYRLSAVLYISLSFGVLYISFVDWRSDIYHWCEGGWCLSCVRGKGGACHVSMEWWYISFVHMRMEYMFVG